MVASGVVSSGVVSSGVVLSGVVSCGAGVGLQEANIAKSIIIVRNSARNRFIVILSFPKTSPFFWGICLIIANFGSFVNLFC